MSEVKHIDNRDKTYINEDEHTSLDHSLSDKGNDIKDLTNTSNDQSSNPDESKSNKKHLTKKLVTIAYCVIVATSLVESFAQDSTSDLASYATSQFSANSLVSTASTVYKITAICAYPVLGKIADLLGRGEGFGVSVFFYTLCYILFATCKNVETYIASEVFFAIGRIGFKVYLLIFIADTTSLLNRGVLSQFPAAITGIPSTYAGSYIQDAFLEHSTWRWGYGAFAIILGVSVIPLTCVMLYVDRISKQSGIRKKIKIFENLPANGTLWDKIKHVLFIEMDFIGFLILMAGCILFFLPFTITGKGSPLKWSEARVIVMLIIGFIALCCFFVWCFWANVISVLRNRIPFIPLRAFKNKSVLIAFILVFLDYTEQSIWTTYFSTVVMVGGYYTAGESDRLTAAKKIAIDIASIIVGIFMKYTRRTKIFVLTGVPLLVLGHGLLVWFLNRNDVMESKVRLYTMQIIFGVGRAFYQVSLQVMIQGLAGVEGIAMSTAFFQSFSMIGALVGTAIAGGMWNGIALGKLEKYLPEANKANATAIYKSITVAKKFKKGTAARTAISLAYRETLQIMGWTSLGIIAPMLLLMFFVREVELTEKHDVYGSDSSDSSDDEKDNEIRNEFEDTMKKRERYVLNQEKRTWKNFWRV